MSDQEYDLGYLCALITSDSSEHDSWINLTKKKPHKKPGEDLRPAEVTELCLITSQFPAVFFFFFIPVTNNLPLHLSFTLHHFTYSYKLWEGRGEKSDISVSHRELL